MSESAPRPKVKRPAGWYGKEQKAMRAVAFRSRKVGAQLVRALAEIVKGVDAQDRVEALHRAQRATLMERARVAGIIVGDHRHRAREDGRILAIGELAAGGYQNVDNIAIPPPAEHLIRGDYVAYRAEKIPGTARSITTLKNLSSDRPSQLFRRGVIDAEIYLALSWYRRQWELSGLAPRVVSSYSERSTAAPNYGHMAKTHEQIDAREEYRWARDSIPRDVLGLFEGIVLHDRTLAQEGIASTEIAAAETKYRNTKAAFMRGALALFEAVRPILKIVY